MQGDLVGVDAQVHAELVRLGDKLKKLDADVMSWLPLAVERSLHLELGMGGMVEYCERVLRYDVHTARERIRVARALLELPKTHDAVTSGTLSYSAAREITRVATADTEQEWFAFAKSTSQRDLEQAVVGRREGDLPTSPRDPRVVLELFSVKTTAEQRAVILAAIVEVQKSVDSEMTAGAALALLCRRMTTAPSASQGADDGAPLPQRAPLGFAQCPTCEAAWVDTHAERIEIEPEAVQRRLCDAKVPDGNCKNPIKKTIEIPAATRRAVWRRDGARCVVPGCRNHRYLEIHHLVSILEGGDHSLDNLAVQCDAHHDAVHRGLLKITGTPSTGLRFEDLHARRLRLQDTPAFTRPDLHDLPASPWEVPPCPH